MFIQALENLRKTARLRTENEELVWNQRVWDFRQARLKIFWNR